MILIKIQIMSFCEKDWKLFSNYFQVIYLFNYVKDIMCSAYTKMLSLIFLLIGLVNTAALAWIFFDVEGFI